MSNLDCDIVVVGAGSIGLAFAAAMRDSGYRILILESSHRPRFNESAYDLRVNTLNLASVAFLDAVGAWSGMIEKRVSPFDRIRVWDPAGGRIEFRADEIGERHLGHVVEASVMTTSLLELVERCDKVDLRFGTPLQSISQDDEKVQIHLTDGDLLSCLLLVGADGGNSTVRESIGTEVSESSYHQTALVARIEGAEPCAQIALQVFLPSGPLAFLPLADGSYSIVWSAENAVASELLSLTDQAFEKRLAAAIDYELGDLRLRSRIVSFELRKVEAGAYFSGRTVLAGDAAHIIHPLAGMGVNLGLMDAATLSEVLMEGKSAPGRDPSETTRLKKYQRWRKSSNVPTGYMMDGFDWGFRHPSKLIQTVLGMGLTLTNRMAFPKREIIRLACGLTGDLPTLARRR